AHAVPAGDDEAQWKAVLRRQGPAVDRVGEQDLAARRLSDRKAALVVLVDPALHAAVHAGEHDVDRAGLHAGLLEDRPERGPRPLRVAHGFGEPRLAQGPRRHARAAVPRAFEGHGEGGRWARSDVFQREVQRPAHMASDAQLVQLNVDQGDVEMDQQVVKAERSELVTERLERHRMVADRELQLFGRDVRAGDEGSRSSRWRGVRRWDRASLEVMQERSEEQVISRLLELENDGQAERRAELTNERFLALLHDPDDGLSYVLRHGTDQTEGAEIPAGTEFYQYPTPDEAQRAFEQLLAESRQAGELVEEDSTDDIGDFESSGAEVRDLFADSDEDELSQDPVISEEE